MTDDKRERISQALRKIAVDEDLENFILFYDSFDFCTYTSSTDRTVLKYGMATLLMKLIEKSDEESNKIIVHD